MSIPCPRCMCVGRENCACFCHAGGAPHEPEAATYVCAGCHKRLAPAETATVCYLRFALHFCVLCREALEQGLARDLAEQRFQAEQSLSSLRADGWLEKAMREIAKDHDGTVSLISEFERRETESEPAWAMPALLEILKRHRDGKP